MNRQVTIRSGHSNRHRISLGLLGIIKSTEFLGHILAKRLAATFLIHRFGYIRNKAVGHFKRKHGLLMVVVLAE
jgi:hypothetical protein